MNCSHCQIRRNSLSCRSQSIYRLKKACHGELDEECNLLTPDQVVDRIFELVDENGDGKSLKLFSDSLKCFMDD